MEFFDSTASIAENINFLADPMMAILGLMIFFQLKQGRKSLSLAREQLVEAKKQLVISSTRDSIKLATELIRYYAEIIVPRHELAFPVGRADNRGRFTFKGHSFMREDLKHYLKGEKLEEYWAESEHMVNELNVANSLEYFATPFVEGVADERVAFNSVAPSFCNTVQTCAVVFCLFRKDEQPLAFDNTIKLYNIWHDRLDFFKKDSLIAKIENDLKAARESQRMNTPTIDPIGTK